MHETLPEQWGSIESIIFFWREGGGSGISPRGALVQPGVLVPIYQHVLTVLSMI